MKKEILNEVNRIKKLMGKSLILEQEGTIAKYLERIFSSGGGEEAVKKVLTKTEGDVKNALTTIKMSKVDRNIRQTAVDNAYRTLEKYVSISTVVDNIISKNLLDNEIKNILKKYKQAAETGQISAEQYKKWFDNYIDDSFGGLDEDIRNIFKNKIKEKYSPEIGIVKTANELKDSLIKELKIKYKDVFDTSIIDEDILAEEALKIEKKWKTINKTEEQIKEETYNRFEELQKIVKESKKINKEKKQSILNQLSDLSKTYRNIKAGVNVTIYSALLYGVFLLYKISLGDEKNKSTDKETETEQTPDEEGFKEYLKNIKVDPTNFKEISTVGGIIYGILTDGTYYVFTNGSWRPY